jgi:hypothetical protein
VDFGLICLLLRYTLEVTGSINPVNAPWWISMALAALLIQLFLHLGYRPEAPLAERWPFLAVLNMLYAPQCLALLIGAIRGETLATNEAERVGPSPILPGIEN